MKKSDVKNILLICGFVSLALFITVVFIDALLKTMFENRELLFKIIEVLFSASASFSFSASLSINISHKEKNVKTENNSDGGDINSINADGKIVNITFNNDGSKFQEQLIALTKRIDSVENANVEAIVDKVSEKMNGKTANSVDNDFVMKYVSESKSISNEEIQEIWASLMVSNATTNNKISKRTLDIVKNLSVEEAKLFETIAPLSFEGGVIYKDLANWIPFYQISLMQDIGLIKTNTTLQNNIEIAARDKLSIVEDKTLVLMSNTTSSKLHFSYDCYALTSEGLQLKRALNIHISRSNVIEFVKKIKEKKIKGLEISAHVVSSIDNRGLVNFNLKDLAS